MSDFKREVTELTKLSITQSTTSPVLWLVYFILRVLFFSWRYSKKRQDRIDAWKSWFISWLDSLMSAWTIALHRCKNETEKVNFVTWRRKKSRLLSCFTHWKSCLINTITFGLHSYLIWFRFREDLGAKRTFITTSLGSCWFIGLSSCFTQVLWWRLSSLYILALWKESLL